MKITDPFLLNLQVQDELRQKRLSRMQYIAVACLVAAVFVYGLAQLLIKQSLAWGYVSAFAEAAMIGAMADWFAVVALFRRPFGLPIPHTAIISEGKNEIARNLGEFIVTHFITTDTIVARVRAHDPAQKLAGWLLRSAGSPKLTAVLTEVALAAVHAFDDEKMRAFVRENIQRKLGGIDMSGMVAELLDLLAMERQHQDLLDAMLSGMRRRMDDPENQEKLAAFLSDALDLDSEKVIGRTLRSILGGLMPRIVEKLQIKAIEVEEDPEHPWRGELDMYINDFIRRLKEDPAWHEKIERIKEGTLTDPRLASYLEGLWDEAKSHMLRDIGTPGSTMSRHLEELATHLGNRLAGDDALRNWVNERILAEIPALVEQHRGNVGRFITQEVDAWSNEQMTRRVELTIGRDLQFIRINGTLVGGLAGLLIYIATQLLKS